MNNIHRQGVANNLTQILSFFYYFVILNPYQCLLFVKYLYEKERNYSNLSSGLSGIPRSPLRNLLLASSIFSCTGKKGLWAKCPNVRKEMIIINTPTNQNYNTIQIYNTLVGL